MRHVRIKMDDLAKLLEGDDDVFIDIPTQVQQNEKKLEDLLEEDLEIFENITEADLVSVDL